MAKFCSGCGKELPEDAKVCPSCGKPVEGAEPAEPAQAQAPAQAPAQAQSAQAPTVIVNVENTNTNANVNTNVNGGVGGRVKNKWIALLFWWFLGVFGGHKFYEGKIGMGVLYLFTGGLFTIGWIIDFWILIFKPTHYVV